MAPKTSRHATATAVPRSLVALFLLVFIFMLLLLAIMVRRGQQAAYVISQLVKSQAQEAPRPPTPYNHPREPPTATVRTLGLTPLLPSPAPIRIAVDPNAASDVPGTYPQLGYLKPASGSGSSGVLPLYGRPSVSRNNRVFYYTIVPNSGGIKVPIHSTGNGSRDCMDDVGCEELSTGDVVNVPDAADASGAPQGAQWTVVIYKFNRM